MERKILGIIICMLLTTTAVIPVAGTTNLVETFAIEEEVDQYRERNAKCTYPKNGVPEWHPVIPAKKETHRKEFPIQKNHYLPSIPFSRLSLKKTLGTILIYKELDATGNPPSASQSDMTGVDDPLYAGIEYQCTAKYSDPDGYQDLQTLHLKLDHPTTTDVEIRCTESGATGSGSATILTGASYLRAATYSYTSAGNASGGNGSITVTWTFTLDWDWIESTLIEYGVFCTDDAALESGWSYSNIDVKYENDLTFTGSLSCYAMVQGTLTSGDWVQGEESLTWTGLTVVYEGTTTVSPNDAHFDIQITDDDTDTWIQTTGANLNLSTTADAYTDSEDVHNIDIINIPAGGSDISTESWTIRVDADPPTNVEIISITPDSTTQLTVTGTATDAQSGIHLEPYWFEEISGNPGGSSSTVWQKNSVWVDDGLSANIRYTYRVKARDAVNNTATSVAQSRYTLANTPTVPIVSGDYDLTNGYHCDVTWNSGGAQDHYHVRSSSDGYASIKYDGMSTSYTESHLSANTSYTYRIYGVNGDDVENPTYSSATGTTPGENRPPDKPSKPSGPTSGRVGTSYSYSSSTIDPDGDQIYYLFDWGDGTTSGWKGPYNSGDLATESHVWDAPGTYSIKVKAKDVHGEESVWSDVLGISMPKNKHLGNPLLVKFLKAQHLPLQDRVVLFFRLLRWIGNPVCIKII